MALMAVVEGLLKQCRFEWCPIISSDSLGTLLAYDIIKVDYNV